MYGYLRDDSFDSLGTLRNPGRGQGGHHPEVKCSILGIN